MASVQLHIGGLYNVYNALAAYSVGKFMGFLMRNRKGFKRSRRTCFGQQEQIQVGNKEITIVLVKIRLV